MIYIACPPKHATGGTELLHQLFLELRKSGKDVLIFYTEKTENPIPTEFSNYDIKFTFQISDMETNKLIIPEIYPNLAKKYQNIQIIFWWLSVDNYLKQQHRLKLYKYILKIQFKLKRLSKYYNYISFNPKDKSKSRVKHKHLKKHNIIHLYQSHYAKYFLINNGVQNIYRLTDYLNYDFLSNAEEKLIKEDLIAYNPKKLGRIGEILISELKNKYNLVAIENLTREEVIKKLGTTKIYIDFGNHPGKDRIPREASILGNVILTGKLGSANNNYDVSIPDTYKFRDRLQSIPKILNHIESIIHDYNYHYLQQSSYRNKILNEKNIFDYELKIILFDIF